jgi:hypothetical protein
LRKQLICFKNTALIVEKGILTEEAIENCTVPVVVDLEMAELVKGNSCYCNKDLTEEELRALVKTINGRETIWGGENCNIDDKSYKSLTFQLNAMFRKYNINECIQKIAFLAMTSVETGFFQTTGEIEGDTNSSQYFYKGRGILQLTGDGRNPVIYSDYQNKIGNAYNIIENPNLVSQKLFLSVDSGGFVWNHIKALKWEPRAKNNKDKDQADYEAKMKAFEWKRNKFAKGLSKNLNEIALLMKENEEDYFFLICRLLQGYTPASTNDYPETLHLDRRKQNLQKLKTWFKYDKNVCDNSGVALDFSGQAPWVAYAVQELKLYGGVRQTESPLKERVVEYFKIAKATWYDHTGYWCGAFVKWCFSQTQNYKNIFDSYDSVTAYNWLPKAQTQKLNPEKEGCKDLDYIENIADIFVGAVIVFNYSHVAFVIGESVDGNEIYYLGGNQSDKAANDGPGKRTICIGKILKTKINQEFWLSKPTSYTPSDEEKKLPKLNVTAYELNNALSR